MKTIKRHYLEIKSIKDLSELPKPSKNLNLELINKPDLQLNKFFYKQIGKKFNWIDRLTWSDDKWIDYLNDKNVSTYVLKEQNICKGYVLLLQVTSATRTLKDLNDFCINFENSDKKYHLKQTGANILIEIVFYHLCMLI